MKRWLIIGGVVVLAGGLLVFGLGAGSSGDYRVRAIFDNANQVTVGEQVRVAGVTVGVIQTLDVTDDNKAAVTLRIDDPGYQDFRSDAHCIIRPQSLIGEQFVDCTPTRPRASGQPEAPPLQTIQSGPGEGDLLLPIANTSSPVGIDLIGNIMRVPQRQRFALILNEFGTALAGNGEALNQAIRRANPALQETDKVLATLAAQNRTLASLATESDQVLAPLARDRERVQAFINSANITGAATAAKGAELQANFQRFPALLSGLTPTMNSLASFSNEFGSFLQPLSGSNVAQLNSIVANLPAFTKSSTNALVSLGTTADAARTALTSSAAQIDKTKTLSTQLVPFAANFGSLFGSFRSTGGWEYLMQTVYFLSAATNGYNQYGHYLRGQLVASPGSCVLPQNYREASSYDQCAANFDADLVTAASAAKRKAALAAALKELTGPSHGLIRPARPKGQSGVPVKTAKAVSPVKTQTAVTSKPSGQSGAATTTKAKSALLDYLIGGGKR